jgi:hypothetical protein
MSADGLETLREVQEHASRKADLDSRNQAALNKVAALLGANYYILDKTWPFLVFNGRQATVGEFYPELNIAIDKFFHMDEWELSIVEFKKEELKKNGIKYAFLTPQKSLADIEPDLGI